MNPLSSNKKKGAEIIPFPISYKHSNVTSTCAEKKAGELVFFTGVRYQRIVNDENVDVELVLRRRRRSRSDQSYLAR